MYACSKAKDHNTHMLCAALTVPVHRKMFSLAEERVRTADARYCTEMPSISCLPVVHRSPSSEHMVCQWSEMNEGEAIEPATVVGA